MAKKKQDSVYDTDPYETESPYDETSPYEDNTGSLDTEAQQKSSSEVVDFFEAHMDEEGELPPFLDGIMANTESHNDGQTRDIYLSCSLFSKTWHDVSLRLVVPLKYPQILFPIYLHHP